MASHPSQMHMGMQNSSPNMDPRSWSNEPYVSEGGFIDDMSVDPKSATALSQGYLKGYGATPKAKLTRDGQPAKRRGPKPDSKPAQTRRQELNRQAQRTHRERKENYIKNLELELARLREAFLHESNISNNTIQQQNLIIENQKRENLALREILVARGIQFENELENRKAVMAMRPKREDNSMTPPSMSTMSPHSVGARSGTYQPGVPPPQSTTTGYSVMLDQTYSNGGGMNLSSHSPGTTHHSHSPQGPDVQEFTSVKQDQIGVPDMPGVFERDPQLGIDFILKLEQTCRDHGEYLVRRSVDSPDSPDEALFSGHALMASVPPPSHVARVPAQQGGLVPTYNHKVPDAATTSILNNLLNLSQSLQSGVIPSGQVTPIMALQSLKGHRNYSSLTREDIEGMIEAIRSKVRCYGFGAVMEDFELRDALSSVFATKPETYETFGNDYTADIDEMYS